MPEKLRLSEAVDEYLAFRQANGMSKNTIKGDRHVLRRLYLVAGDVYLSHVTSSHLNSYVVAASATRTPASLTIDHAKLSAFFNWAVSTRQVARHSNPMEGRRAPRYARAERDRVPMKDFGRLLDAAGERHARDRMVIALGLYLLLRGGEVADLRVGDVNLEAGEVRVRIPKTKEEDVMPICQELDSELRAWLTYYTREQGPPQRDWFLVPARIPYRGIYDPGTRGFVAGETARDLNPTRRVEQIEKIAHRALEGVGFATRREDGGARREGMHTLRRSGARARFDTLEQLGYDGAIRHVQTLLHHKSMSTTEGYLGLTLDRVKRNELVRGKRMFGVDDGATVVPLWKAASGSQDSVDV